MKVLLIDVNYQHSSTGKIVSNLASSLIKDGHEAKVLYGRGKRSEDGIGIRIAHPLEVYFHAFMSRITGLLGYFSYFATRRIIKEIDKFRPDIIHLHELHGYYVNYSKIIEYIKKNNIPTVWTFHCEFAYTGKCGYAYDCNKWQSHCGKCPELYSYPKSLFFDFTGFMHSIKKQDFKDFDKLVIVTPSKWLANRVRLSFLQKKDLKVIYNGIDTLNIFYPRQVKKSNKKTLLSVAPDILSDRKGGMWIIQLAKEMGEDYQFILVGVKEIPNNLPKNVICISRTENQDELAEYYSQADIFLICSKRENFPTTCLEALACGLPIMGFDTGGTSETAPKEFGRFSSYGNLKSLRENIEGYFSGNLMLKTSAECRDYAIKNYSNKQMYNQYYAVYQSLID